MGAIEKELPRLDERSAVKLADFVRACKAAARAVGLYPPAHPAIRMSLARLVDAAGELVATGPVTLGVLPDNLLMDGRPAERPDAAIRETAALLHEHMIGALTIYARSDVDGWLPFLQLLSRTVEDIKNGGGIARLWAAASARHLEIQEIDYSDILRDRGAGDQAHWRDVIRACLNPASPDLDDETLRALMDACGSAGRFGELAAALEQASGASAESKAQAMMRILRGVVDMVSRRDPQRLEPLLRSLAEGLAGISPGFLMGLLSAAAGRRDAEASAVRTVASRMPGGAVAGFVAHAVVASGGASMRLAQAFQALVPDMTLRTGVLELAGAEALRMAPGGAAGESFLDMWKGAADMLLSYQDEQYISDSYAQELSSARAQALEVERVSDDPTERIAAWLGSVDPAEIRALDLRLLLDLLAVEGNPDGWRKATTLAAGHAEDLLLVGEFDGARQLIEAMAREMARDPSKHSAAAPALGRLVDGSMAKHVASHLRTADAGVVEQIEAFCHAVGPSAIRPLAEMLSLEKRAAVRQRLVHLLLGFGASGRRAIEQLKGSDNPAVRRTAVYLLREFGGSEALPELTTLLDDAETHVQREAVRAILTIGTEEAYTTLQNALMAGTGRTRESLVGALVAMRSERAVPLFEFIVRKIDRKGPLRWVYIRAVESLGALRAESAVDLLTSVLYAGEWWAPFRTAELRRTAAAALRQIGSPNALRALDDAAARGSRGVRAAVRALHA